MKTEEVAARVTEEELYAKALREIEPGGVRRDGIWAKALAGAGGDDKKTIGLYIEYRVQSLRDESELNKAAAEKQATEARAAAPLERIGKAMQWAGMKEETMKRALTQGGTIVAWGENDKGQTTAPAGLSGVVAIAAGGLHTVALKQDATVVAWGRNDEGQTKVPAGLSRVVAIAAGGAHTVVLRLE